MLAGFYIEGALVHHVDMTIRVRPATEDDRPNAVDLAHRLMEGVAPWHDSAAVSEAVRSWVETSMNELDGDRRTCFIAEEDNQVTGFVSVSQERHWAGATNAYIGELVVAKHAEGRGIGRALVERASVWGRLKGCHRIILETGAANTAALSFYRALEFEDEDIKLSRRL